MNPFDAKGISIDRLRSFCAVVEHGSITSAVGDDPVRQSQFSRQIKELEQAMEVRLFERRNRRLIPTAAGRSLALLTQRYFDAVLAICRESTTERRKLTVVAGDSVLEGFIMPRFGRLQSCIQTTFSTSRTKPQPKLCRSCKEVKPSLEWCEKVR